MEDFAFLESCFDRFYPVGALPNGGVRRLGYTVEENAMHQTLKEISSEMEFFFRTDEVGNSFVSLDNPSFPFVVGSHLDSVPNGGRYDGVAGILAGLLLLKWVKERALDLPLSVVAFRCEESSRFGQATVGSHLASEKLGDKLAILHDSEGVTLEEAIEKAGFNPCPYRLKVRGFLELHIEQGRVLEEKGIPIGIVTSIAAPVRLWLDIKGRQDHSGATPMEMRKDALTFASEVVLLVEKLGRAESHRKSVATVGVLHLEPNAMNVVPGHVGLGIDIRGIDLLSREEVVQGLVKGIEEISLTRDIEYVLKEISREDPVSMDEEIISGLEHAATFEGVRFLEMPSGAGHDAMVMASVTKAGMLFIPCRGGISHNPQEEANLEDVHLGARIMLRYLEEAAKGGE